MLQIEKELAAYAITRGVLGPLSEIEKDSRRASPADSGFISSVRGRAAYGKEKLRVGETKVLCEPGKGTAGSSARV